MMRVTAIIVTEFFVGTAMQLRMAVETMSGGSDHGPGFVWGTNLATKIGVTSKKRKRIYTLSICFFSYCVL